jgi:hypothetical protein
MNMTDLKKMQLEQAKDLAIIGQTGFDTSEITNTVHISNDPTRPSYGSAASGGDFVFSEVGGNVYGFGGDDILMGGNSGHYAFHGGTGNDTVAYVNAVSGATIALDPNVLGSYPTITNAGAAYGDTYDSIENVVGSNFSDIIYGDAHDNKLYGGAGDDRLNGGGGNDVINGGDGNDQIWGLLDGTDVVSGGDHKDVNGNNIWGKDYFNFDLVGGHNFNLTITDFHPQIWTGNRAPTEAQAMADPLHDVLQLTFEQSTGVMTDAQADAAFVLTNGDPFKIVGHDVVLTIHTSQIDGTITLSGAADLLTDSNHHFTVYDGAVHPV